MFENLTREIILLSVIPVAIIILIDLIVFLVMRKKKEEDEKFRFNYFIKVSLIIANAFVLPLIGGYAIWVISSFISKGILSQNILFVALLIFLWIILFVLLIWVYLKSLREFNEKEDQDDKNLDEQQKEEPVQ